MRHIDRAFVPPRISFRVGLVSCRLFILRHYPDRSKSKWEQTEHHRHASLSDGPMLLPIPCCSYDSLQVSQLWRPAKIPACTQIPRHEYCGISGATVRLKDGYVMPVSYTHLRAHETRHDLVCRLLLEKKKK